MAWGVLLGAGLLIALVVLLQRVRGRRDRKAFGRICAALDASPAGMRAGGTEQGMGYRLEHGRSGGSPFLRLTLVGQCPHRWQARCLPDTASLPRAEDSARVVTGDVLFDQKVDLRSDGAEFTAAYFNDLRHQRAAQKLFELGVTNLSLDGSLEATWSAFELGEDSDPQLVTAALHYLIGMASGLPGFGGSAQAAGTRTPRTPALVFPALLLLSGVALNGWAWARFPPVDLPRLSALVAVATLLLALVFIWILRRVFSFGGRPWSTFLLSAPALPLLACGALVAVNGWGDGGTPAAYAVTAVDRRPLRLPWETHWFVEVRPWRKRDDAVWLWTGPRAPATIVAGQTRLLILTRSGRIGIEWLVEMSTR